MKETSWMLPDKKRTLSKVLFLCLLFLMALPLISSPVALVAGFVFSLLFGNPFPTQSAWISKSLLKLAVVGLGFGVNITEVLEVGRSSLLLTLLSISATLVVGTFLGRILQVSENTHRLVCFGTAICGGSAIAALAPVIKAKDEEIAVSMATVFTLNAVALVLFPPLGHLFDLSQRQFGLWAALAIHDTSSVVGASAAFGAVALAVGTTAKLTRALWIAPYTLVAGVFYKSEQRVGIPAFILGFIVAAGLNSWWPGFDFIWSGIYLLAKQALVVCLFLIGASLTRKVLGQVGMRPLLLGIILWSLVSVTTLLLILKGYIQ